MLRSALLLALLATPLAHAAPAALTTISERSGFLETGRYDEVAKLCGAFQKAYPKAVRCFEFGRTPQGRPMLALAVSRSGALTAADAKRRGLPVLLVQGGIHSGEIDGKDAGFLALREALENHAAPGALDKQVLLFVPVFNIDGHERFGKWNRPNQRGPVEMGWRSTAQNYNLNRDYMKADAPEMQAMLALVNDWDPLAYVDLHVTDGAKFQPDISIQVEPVHAGDSALRQAGTALRDNVLGDLAKQGSDPKSFYMSFAEEDNPQSGFVDSAPNPRFSHGYFLLRNRFGMLVETHSWKDYPTRVRITRNTIVALLSQVAQHGAEWLAIAHQADARSARLAGTSVPLTYKTTEKSHVIDFKGYAYTRTLSDVSGALMTRYDENTPQTWSVPLRDEVVTDLAVDAPAAGYLVPAAQAAVVAAKLKQHGVSFTVLKHAPGKVDVETFRADDVKFGAKSFEGRQTAVVTGAWKPEARLVGAGSLFVPVGQAKGRLVIALLEPRAPDSLLAWGTFNTAFERKEYMEDYVAEDVAREQLGADPALAAQFRKKLESEPAFAANPQARLEFFARRHSSWDEHLNLYPVMRTAVAPAL
ncbi:M14 family metallopeptidase [Janthinobacterium agaricidamnosum]|uniref:Zinc carboxypeptidase family protein n=1 Tax=Janthinobacterium agaricidamnosum NBRC 102515 = DSM 9628 TaxID=1349767 RepID=W0V9X3_9BURK|nr:M14 family metallopeptidase [Janthinobacterium agaricidamnosum]CDG85619.1 zinc carboxypeptidase family protein [Janthinobacterium agaricidamnosum NBRC 102515 = DSM 9628]